MPVFLELKMTANNKETMKMGKKTPKYGCIIVLIHFEVQCLTIGSYGTGKLCVLT